MPSSLQYGTDASKPHPGSNQGHFLHFGIQLVQLVGGRRLRFSIPPGLFDDAVKAVRGRFGNLVTEQRRYTIRFPGQERTRQGRTPEYPALEIGAR